ncbi:MAG: two-component regulator propeller domain-containing protein [Rhodothermales bacterium]
MYSLGANFVSMFRIFGIFSYGVMGLLLVTTTLRAQPSEELSFERLAEENDLPSAAVTSLWQDRDGFLWLGTLDGLGRYDGHEIKVFRHEEEDITTLSDSYLNVRALFEDQAGQIWVGTRQGLNRYDPATGRVRRYRHDPDDARSLSHDNVLALSQTRHGVLWVGTQDGLNRYDPSTDDFIRYHHDPQDSASLSRSGVTALAEDQAGRLWIGTRQGLNRYDAEADHFIRYYRDSDALPGFSHDDVFSLYADRAGQLWVGTWGGGLFRIDRDAGHVTAYPHIPDDPRALPHTIVTAIEEDRHGTLWIGTWGGGLARLDPVRGTFVQYAHDLDDDQSLADNRVTSILEDRTGVLWVGTYDGLSRSLLHRPFFTYTYRPYLQTGLSHPKASQVYVSTDGALWVGTLGGGLNRLDRTTGVLTRYRHDPGDPSSLSHDEVTAIWEDADGALWVGTLGGGLNRLDRATGVFTRYRHAPGDSASLGRDRIYAAYQDADGLVWITTVFRGLAAFDLTSERYRYYTHDPANPQSLSADMVWPIFEDHTGALWVGTLGGGLNRLDRTTGTFTRYRHDADAPQSLSGDRILTIAEDAGGTLWIGTMGEGINRFDRATERFYAYTTADGLPHNNVACILPDDRGHLWIGTMGGLARFDPDLEQFVRFGTAEGLPDAGFYFNSCHRTPQGELVFGTMQGVVLFHPDSLQLGWTPSPLAITGFDVFNQPAQLDSAITHIHRIERPHDDNFVAFHYAALDFRAPTQHQYTFKLEGLDREWVSAGSRRYASYPNLSPGTYVFRVRTLDFQGHRGKREASVHLVILPPWWQTRWAYLLYGLGFTLLVLGFIRWRAARQRQQHLEEHARRIETLDKAKSRFFSNISHEFRTPLTLIIGPIKSALAGEYGLLSESLRSQHQMMLRNGERLRRLINQLLDLAQLEEGQTRLAARRQDLTRFVEKTTLAFAPLAERYRIDLTCSTHGPCWIYFDADALEKVLANLLSNAMKFVPAGGQVQVAVLEHADKAEVVVADTGCGIAADKLPHLFDRFYHSDHTPAQRQEGTGIGLALAKELVALHAGAIHVTSEVGRGSTFTVSLKKGRHHLAPDQIVDEEKWRRHRLAPLQQRPPTEPARTLEVPAPPSSNGATAEETAPASGEDIDRITILVVDDNADIRRFVRSFLEPVYRVLEAENGKQGLQRARQALPDLIVADVMMPEMGGFELCRHLGQDPQTDCIPVVLLTARAALEDELEGLGSGAVDYITKPFEAETLRARLESLLALRRRLRDRFAASRGTMSHEDPPRSDFVRRVCRIIEEHLQDDTFSVLCLTQEVGLSYSRLHARLTEEYGMSPSQLIRTIRLERAAELLRNREGYISEIAYAVGFNSLSYFNRRFREQYGMTPSKYLEQAAKGDL